MDVKIAFLNGNLDDIRLILFAKEPRDHQRVKHEDIRYNFIRDLIATNKIKIVFVSSKNQLADIVTKGLPLVAHVHCRELFGLK